MITYTWVLLENWTQLGTTCDSVSKRDYFYHKVESQLCITAFCMDAESRGAYPSSHQLNPRTVHQSTIARTHTHTCVPFTHTLNSASPVNLMYIFLTVIGSNSITDKHQICSQSSSEFPYNEASLPSLQTLQKVDEGVAEKWVGPWDKQEFIRDIYLKGKATMFKEAKALEVEDALQLESC